jgi:hypothetical protein
MKIWLSALENLRADGRTDMNRQTVMTRSWLCTPLCSPLSLTLNAKYTGRVGDSPHAKSSVVACFSHLATFLSSALCHVT